MRYSFRDDQPPMNSICTVKEHFKENYIFWTVTQRTAQMWSLKMYFRKSCAAEGAQHPVYLFPYKSRLTLDVWNVVWSQSRFLLAHLEVAQKQDLGKLMKAIIGSCNKGFKTIERVTRTLLVVLFQDESQIFAFMIYFRKDKLQLSLACLYF